MLTGKKAIVYWVSVFKQHYVNKIAFIVLRGEKSNNIIQFDFHQ